MPYKPSVILSRLVLVAGLLSASAAVYWFLQTTFVPVEIGAPVPVQSVANLRFDPSVDVSKKPGWGNLRPITTMNLEEDHIAGRENPFAPFSTSTVP
jgi:hypothetical protein